MPQQLQSPPRPQGPRLVDEDSSPSASLLLSTSDCTSPGQAPQQRRRSSKRKQYLCRHFLRTGGWCPAGAQCKFLHDVAALPAGVGKAAHALPFDPDTYGEQRRSITSGVLTGIQQPSPPIVRQAHLEPRFTETEQRPNQPFYCSNYAWQPYQPYYPAMMTAIPVTTTTAPPSVVQHGLYPQAPPQTQSVPPHEAQTDAGLPLGTYEANGTMYFPTPAPPPIPPPAPVPYSVPSRPAPYNHMMVAPSIYPYACYVPLTLPPSYYSQQPAVDMGGHSQTCFDPFASERVAPDELPVIPRLEDYQMPPPVQHELSSPLRSSPPALTVMATKDKDQAVQEHEFPYQPPKEQRVGHARRISINIKKQGQPRSNSG